MIDALRRDHRPRHRGDRRPRQGAGRAPGRRGRDRPLHARTRERGEQALADLEPGGGDLRLHVGDLSSLAEVRALAQDVLDAHERLDVLVNNAGIGSTVPGGGARMESADGFELRFAVNYLAGLRPRRAAARPPRESAPARIVNVASAGQMAIDFDDVMLERSYDGTRAYCQCKLAQVMFTRSTSPSSWPARASPSTRSTPRPTCRRRWSSSAGVRPVSTLAEGLDATWRLVADPALDGVTGRYFNGTREARADPQAYDPEARRRLWELAERLAGT